ncbi:hypothetical protein V6N13_117335 [Hibiscus sabdariffa]|uniref:FAE domain-containing protein n=1 Tax=Hibiscus sabdariffa TaxID=183260 RepID=A0ABR2PA93_9ROSI
MFVATVYLLSKPRSIYLVDYECYKPPVTCRVPFSAFMEHSRLILSNPKSVEFQMRILERSGLGEETCLPPAIHYIPPSPTMDAARGAAEMPVFSDAVFVRVHPNSNAVVVSTEIITPNYYHQGKERAMLLPNCLFRIGGAAILLSNLSSDRWRSKYRLEHVVRTHKAYRCVFEEEDKEGNVGISLSKDVMADFI